MCCSLAYVKLGEAHSSSTNAFHAMRWEIAGGLCMLTKIYLRYILVVIEEPELGYGLPGCTEINHEYT
jgi:hypothetical protein